MKNILKTQGQILFEFLFDDMSILVCHRAVSQRKGEKIQELVEERKEREERKK